MATNIGTYLIHIKASGDIPGKGRFVRQLTRQVTVPDPEDESYQD